MDNKIILLMSEYETPVGIRHMVWKVGHSEFMDMRDRYVDEEGCTPQDAARWALDKFIMDNKAEYLGTTDNDAELFAANMREAGLKARCIK